MISNALRHICSKGETNGYFGLSWSPGSQITEFWSFKTGICEKLNTWRSSSPAVQVLRPGVLRSLSLPVVRNKSWATLLPFPTSPRSELTPLGPVLKTQLLRKICLMKGFCWICVFSFQAIDLAQPPRFTKMKGVWPALLTSACCLSRGRHCKKRDRSQPLSDTASTALQSAKGIVLRSHQLSRVVNESLLL